MTGDHDSRPGSRTEPDAMEQPGSEAHPPLSAEEDEPDIEPMAGPPSEDGRDDSGHGYGYE